MTRAVVREIEHILRAGDREPMRYTKREKFHLNGVAERVERHGLGVGEAVRILADGYRLERRHSRESIRSTLMNYRSKWRRRLHPPERVGLPRSTSPGPGTNDVDRVLSDTFGKQPINDRFVMQAVSGDDFRAQGSDQVTEFVDAVEKAVRAEADRQGLTVRAILWYCIAIGPR